MPRRSLQTGPVAVLAASTPGDCFATMIEAFRIAVRYMTPVVVLSDGQPMGGELNDPLEILGDIVARNELLRVRIHAVSFQCPGTLLQDLAAATGGEYREVE